MAGHKIGIKWKKSFPESQYFQKISENKWTEYQNGVIFANFTEISFQYPIVILKKDDGLLVKLTENDGFWGSNQNSIINYFCDGKWESSAQTVTQSNQNASQLDVQQQSLHNSGTSHFGIKWKKSFPESQYFQKISENKWTEYQNGVIFANFTEISFQYPIVILKKDDGLLVKLTENAGYWGSNQNSIINYFCDGNWVESSPQQNPSQVSNESQINYQKLIAAGNQLLFRNEKIKAINAFKQALDTYNAITQDSDVLSFFNLADLSLIDYIRRGKKQCEDMIAFANENSDEKLDASNNNSNQNQNFDQHKSKELYENALKNIASIKFNDALSDLKNAVTLDPTNDRTQSALFQVTKLIENEDSFNKMIAEGNRESLNKNYDLAKEKYHQASNVHLSLTNDPKIVGLFRDAHLDLYEYIKNGTNQVNHLISLFQNDLKIDSKADDLKKDASRAIKDLNYENALEMLNIVASLKNPNYNVDEEVSCLKKTISNREASYRHIRDGIELKKEKKYEEAIQAFRKASAIYLEITLDVTFIKMNNGDIYEYIGKNKADDYLKETEKILMDNGEVSGSGDFWETAPVIGE